MGRLSTTWLIVIEVTLQFEVLTNSILGVCICIVDNGSAVVDDVSLPKRMCVLRIDSLFYGKWVLCSNYNTNTITYPITHLSMKIARQENGKFLGASSRIS